MKPHKYVLGDLVKTSMPPPKKVLQLETMKMKGLEVEYPTAPWFEDYKLKLQEEILLASKRAKTAGEILIP